MLIDVGSMVELLMFSTRSDISRVRTYDGVDTFNFKV